MTSRAARWLLVSTVACVAGCGSPPSRFPAHDPGLRRARAELYPAYADSTRQRRPRAFLVFFGNDVGFWGPYRDLAADLAADGYATAGFDVRGLLSTLPETGPARDSAFVARVTPLIAASRAELRADAVPALLGGHSFGAEVALWLAVHAPPPGLAGVLDIAPGSRGHLRVTLADIANTSEPTEPGSFAVSDEAGALGPDVRLALVRGEHDPYGSADADILRAGGARTQAFPIPLAGHSLRRLLLVTPVVRRAAAWLVAPRGPTAR